MDVSIIIVNWNTRALLADCLRSIEQNAGPVSREVIVVDNASTDGSAAMVRRTFPQVTLIANRTNQGFAAANNRAIASARGRYLLLLNPDTRILDGAIAKVVAFADARPRAGIVGCHTTFPDGTLQWNCYMFPSLLNLALSMSRLSSRFQHSRFFGRYRLTWWQYDTPRIVDAVAGCFMLVRRAALERVGPMSERYFMYSEDTDWCWRFRRHGWLTMYTPDAHIIHVRAASSSQCATDMHVAERRSLLLFLEMKSGRLTREAANAMFVAGSLLRLGGLALRRANGGWQEQSIRQQWELSAAGLRFHLLGREPVSAH